MPPNTQKPKTKKQAKTHTKTQTKNRKTHTKNRKTQTRKTQTKTNRSPLFLRKTRSLRVPIPTPEIHQINDPSILFCHNGICIRKASNGLGTFATRNIPTGTIIMREKPHNLPDKFNNNEYKFMLIRKLLANPETKAQFESLVPTSIHPDDENVVPYSEIEQHHRTYLPELTPEQARLYVMKYKRNAFSCNNQPGILFNGTRMNHSCNPNITYHMDGDHMVFKAKRPIRRNEELFDSYIDSTLPHSDRQRLLQQRYGFQCQCDKCKSSF